jgi:hypothetical protein
VRIPNAGSDPDLPLLHAIKGAILTRKLLKLSDSS